MDQHWLLVAQRCWERLESMAAPLGDQSVARQGLSQHKGIIYPLNTSTFGPCTLGATPGWAPAPSVIPDLAWAHLVQQAPER